MRAWGFSDDPFVSRAGEVDKRLAQAFVAPNYFDAIVGDPQQPGPSIVFGWRGEGKSALCTMVAARLRQQERPPLIVESTDFTGWPVDRLESLTLDDHIWRILQACVTALVRALESGNLPTISASDRALLEDFVLRWLHSVSHRGREVRLGALLDRLAPNEHRIHRYGGKGYRRIASYLRGKRFEFEQAKIQGKEIGWLLAALMLIAPSTPESRSFAGATPQSIFNLFVGLVLRLGFPSLFVLVDNVDENDVVNNQPDLITRLVRPLVTSLNFLEPRGRELRYGIKIFLPGEARSRLINGIRIDRIRPYDIEWNDDRLKKFLTARIRAYSDGRHESLAHVFEDHASLEQRLLRAAGRTPRNMLRILDEIVREHCEQENPPPKVNEACVAAGFGVFSEHRRSEGDRDIYQARLDAWDREHSDQDGDPS